MLPIKTMPNKALEVTGAGVQIPASTCCEIRGRSVSVVRGGKS